MENQPTTTVSNPYGLAALWSSGDIIARSVLILLLIMSLASWYVMLTKLWDQSKLKKSARVVEKQFWTAPSIKDGVEQAGHLSRLAHGVRQDGADLSLH